ncbi:ATP-binding protein [Oerskovia sp. M15]
MVRIPDPVSDPVTSALSPAAAGGSCPASPRRSAVPATPCCAPARRGARRQCQRGARGLGAGGQRRAPRVGHLALRLFDTGDGLRVEVEDSNPAPPVSTDGHVHRMGGFGMQIVERLADWGWRPAGSGKLVWARLRPVGERQDRPQENSVD